MKNHVNCPNCGHSLELTKSRHISGGTGRAPQHATRQIMAMGSVSPLPAFKSHIKPIFSFQWEYLGMAALVGAGATLLTSVVISSACYFAGQCFETPFGGITTLVLTFAVSFVSALQFFDGGRYERKDEPTTAAAYAPPVPVVKQEPQIIRVELKEKRSATSTRYSWFDLPPNITPEVMIKLGKGLNLLNWQWSRRKLVHHGYISRHYYDLLQPVLKERNLLVVENNASHLTAAGRMLFKQFIEAESVAV